ncbi:MAG: class I SAM-dependent methyltransferase, partial [Planctomycetota bacterium]
EEYALAWRGFGDPDPVVRSYRRPLESMLNPLIEAGFRIDRILEPKPTEAFRETRPGDYDSLMREPVFLCVRATR